MHEDGIEVKNVTVSQKERTPAEQAKLDAIIGLLNIIPLEEVDKFFIENMTLAKTLGYRLQADPAVLLKQIDKEYS